MIVFCTSHVTDTPGSTFASSSITRHAVMKLAPVPECASTATSPNDTEPSSPCRSSGTGVSARPMRALYLSSSSAPLDFFAM